MKVSQLALLFPMLTLIMPTGYSPAMGTCCAAVVLMDLDGGMQFDLTDTLRTAANIGEIVGVTAVNAIAGGGDEWLIIEGDNMIQFLDSVALTPLFRLPESNLRDLFQLPDGDGWISALTPPGRSIDTLLYYDAVTSGWFAIDLETGSAGGFPDLTLTEEFYSGFGFTETPDIGMIVRNSEQNWWYETLPERQIVELDLAGLLGSAPKHFSEFRYDTESTVFHFIVAVTEGSNPGTPTSTPTPGPGTPTVTPTPGTSSYDVVIAMGLGETLWKIDGTDYSAQSNLAYTGQSPNQIIAHNGELFVVNSLSHSVTVYDPASLSLKRELSVGIGTNPFTMAFVDSDSFYITLFNSNTIKRVNAWTGEILAEIALPSDLPADPGKTTYPRPVGIGLSGNTAWVACANLDTSYLAGGPGVIVMVDTTTNQVSGWFESGGRNCVNVSINPQNTSWLWAVNAGDYSSGQGFLRNGTLAVFDIDTHETVQVIPVPDAPMELVFGPQRGYYASAADGRVGRVDPLGLSVLSSVDLPTAGQNLNFVSGLAIGSDNKLWVLEFNHDKSYVLDMNADDALIRTITVGSGPDALIIVER